jgi:hypothetical protein
MFAKSVCHFLLFQGQVFSANLNAAMQVGLPNPEFHPVLLFKDLLKG